MVKIKCYCKIFEYNDKLCHLKSDLNIKELNSSKYPVIKKLNIILYTYSLVQNNEFFGINTICIKIKKVVYE